MFRRAWRAALWTLAAGALLIGLFAAASMPGTTNSVVRDPHRAALTIAGGAGVVALGLTLLGALAGIGPRGRELWALLAASIIAGGMLALVPAIA